MNKIWKYFMRWGLSKVTRAGAAMPLLLGVAIFLALVAIWWMGPHWRWHGQYPLASMAHRSVASLVLVLLPLLCWLLVLRLRVQRLYAERRQKAEVQADPCLPFIQAQECALDRGLANYLDNAGGQRALYQLPWYLVLGAEGAGKSSFIAGSDQGFSLTRISKAQARSCQEESLAYPVQWWIGNDAVLIDPPGELITQKALADCPRSAPGDTKPELPAGTQARLWKHLLGWLARNRSRRALNGLVLVVDLASLLQARPEQRKALADVLRSRLHELSIELGSRLPLYVVLSKFDLLDGFDQLFARMTASQREQTLGFTFKLDAISTFDAWLDELACHYDRLVQVLQEHMHDGLGALGNTEQCQRLVSLQAQLIGLRPALMSFLREALASDRFTTPALVRGVYFSSVLQRGETNNAFLRAAGLPYKVGAPLSDAKPQGRSLVYFAQHIFQRVVYQEAGLAGDNVKIAREKRRLRWVSAGVGLLAIVMMGATWHRYFDINRNKATSVLAKTAAFGSRAVDEQLDPTGRNLLAPLAQIRDAVSVYGDYRSAWPVLADFGLYQGRAIGPRVDAAYLNLLSRRFLPAIASGVVDAMLAAPSGSEQQMAALRVYRMIEDRSSRKGQWVEEWMAHRWQSAYPGQGQVQRDLMRHLQYALAYADTDLLALRQRIDEVQQSLRKVPLPQRVYAGLKRRAQEQLPGSLDLRHQVGPVFDLVYQPVTDNDVEDEGLLLRPLLTAKGFKTYFVPRSREVTDMAMVDQWALGERDRLDYSKADREVLTEQIRDLYSMDYIDSWRRALNAFAIVDFQDLGHGVSVLEHLTGPAAPLRRLLETVRDNTLIETLEPPGQERTARVGLEGLGRGDEHQVSNIRRAFASLNGLLEAKEGRPSYYDETLAAMSAVHDYARAVQESPNRGKSALQAVLQRFSMKGPDPIATLQRVATGLPEPIRKQVSAVAEQTAYVLVVEALRELDRRWDAEVYSFFQQRLAGRYPFVAQGADASLDDFEAFFGPKGRLQAFQDQYLNVFLKDNFDALYTDIRGEHLIRSDVIEQLQAAERIRETFFDQRGNLGVQFSIEPLGLSPNQRTSLLDLDGQLISYTHGPSQVTGVIWPNTLGPQVRSNLTLLKLNGTSSSLEYHGPWSMYRLLSRGALNGRTPTSVDLSFRMGGGLMRYQLSSQKAFNPITQQPFKGFRLPRTLLEASATQLVQAGSAMREVL